MSKEVSWYNLTMNKVFLLIVPLLFLVPLVGSAENLTEYTLLETLPGVQSSEGKATANTYIAGLFQLLISLAIAFAVMRLIYAGFVYMSTDAYSGKNEAKNIITETFWGLGFVLGAWLIVALILPSGPDCPKGTFCFDISLPTEKLPEDTNKPDNTNPGTGNCIGCVTLSSLNLPASGSAVGKSISPFTGDKLKILNNGLRANNIGWSITEGYPPSIQHEDPCHNNGTCVDAKLSNPTADNINRFYNGAVGAGMSGFYEVQTQAAKKNLEDSGVNIPILVNTRATGTHFHIKG